MELTRIIGKERRSIFIISFISLGLGLQFISYAMSGEELSLFSGCAGVLAVVLCSLKKLSQYIFSFTQLFTYVILAWEQRFYGELAENAFYFVTMLFGIWFWIKGYSREKQEINTLALGRKARVVGMAGMIVLIIGLWLILRLTDDSQPFLDSVSTVPAIIGQTLLILRYRENWICWLIIDLASVWMWWCAGDLCMVSQFVFWSFNCLLGWKLWG